MPEKTANGAEFSLLPASGDAASPPASPPDTTLRPIRKQAALLVDVGDYSPTRGPRTPPGAALVA